MNLEAKQTTLDIRYLFCHDSNKCNHPYDNGKLADILTEMANDMLLEQDYETIWHIDFVAAEDTGLSRWTIHWQDNKDEAHTTKDRIYSPAQLFSALPDPIVRILKQLNQSTIQIN